MTIGLELGFPSDLAEAAWRAIFDVLFAWRPQLAPQELKRLSDAGAPRREPWTDTHRADLARRLATENALAWTIFCANASILCVLEPRFVKLAVLMKGEEDATSALASLVEALAKGATPRIAMGFEPETDDRELVSERLVAMPAVLFLGKDTVDVDVEHRVIGGGRLLVRSETTRAALGLSEDAPLAVFD